ncbi:MAG TPA: NAD-dependent epimerase/dehydratase family protein [Pirellulales bacterium]|nr:NAD-dependent epimerase/dehydratase family protein [Pirellulales bacterium]
MAILVTGGAGFIGSHLIERLLATRADDIVCLDNFNDYYDPRLKRANVSSFEQHPRVRIVEGSLCSRRTLKALFQCHAIDVVVHLGAYAGVRASFATPLIYEKTNAGGTLALLDAATRAGVGRFLLASSSTVYGLGAAVPFEEDQPLGTPSSPYGASKRSAELLSLLYHQVHRLPVVILRLFSVYGPRLRPDLAMTIFAKALTTGRAIKLSAGGIVRRDFTYVDDVCDGLLAALDSDRAIGHAINLGSNHPVSMIEMIGMLESAVHARAIIERRAPALGDLPITCADLTKAESLLGYRPRVGLADGIERFAAWFVSQARLN